jgi:hypothetical protein
VTLDQRAGIESPVRGFDDEIRPLEEGFDMGVAGHPDRGFLRRVQELEEGSVAAVECLAAGRPTTQRVALSRLDLDDLGIGIGEEFRRVRAGDAVAEINDAQFAQSLHDKTSGVSRRLGRRGVRRL